MTAQPNPARQATLVALVGRPNVGKSTLFNRITKTRKAIVDPTPGVTRDRHYERVEWNDRPFILVDTGGIDTAPDDRMVTSIREQSMAAIEEADVICFLLDGREGLTRSDYEVTELLRRTEKPIYFVVNKIDSPELEATLLASFYELGADRLWPVAAEHGYGIKNFLDALVAGFKESGELPPLPENTISLAFLGRPNVGKSSLINRLVGEERMVVSNIPGTTRDSVDTMLATKHQNYLLIDTAGIRRKGKVQEKLEKFSVMRSLAALERADIALLVIDAEEGITEQDTKVIGYALEQGRACILVVNKWDLVKNDAKRQKQIREEISRLTGFVGFAPVLTVSALTGTGVAKLFPTVGQVYRQYNGSFSTGKLNRILQEATDSHPAGLYRGKRLKFYYTTQVTSKPPSFAVFTNYPKGVHFSYERYLMNTFREQLGLDKVPVRLFFRERQRRA